MSSKILTNSTRINSILLMLVLFSGGYCKTLLAQGVDDIAPIIEFEEISQVQANPAQVFTVQIAENNELKDAILYFRREGQLPFNSLPLDPLGNSGYYSATLETDPTDLRPIEYYFQARDMAGNRTVSGFAFDPYRRTIVAGDAYPADTTTSNNVQTIEGIREPSGTSWLDQTWVKVTLGVIAVGVLATALDSDDENRQLVPVTINLQ